MPTLRSCYAVCIVSTAVMCGLTFGCKTADKNNLAANSTRTSTATVSAQELKQINPTRYYPKGSRFYNAAKPEPLDTALSTAPIEVPHLIAKKYFPDFNPDHERVFSNVSSGIENEFYVVKVPYEKMPRQAAVHGLYILHENFDRNFGLMHGYMLFVTPEDQPFEYKPQNQKSTRLESYKSRYIVAGYEGLRKPGMKFNLINANDGSLVASWNFYTLEAVAAMTAGTGLVASFKASGNGFSAKFTTPRFLSPPYIQQTLLQPSHVQAAFDGFTRKAVHESFNQLYSLKGKTCNHAIEDLLAESGHPAEEFRDSGFTKLLSQSPITNIADEAQRRLGYYHPIFFHRRLEILGFALQNSRTMALEFEPFAQAFRTVISRHQPNVTYGRP